MLELLRLAVNVVASLADQDDTRHTPFGGHSVTITGAGPTNVRIVYPPAVRYVDHAP